MALTMAGTRKIEMKMREKKEQRMVTFSKRRQGLFKKAAELHRFTGASTAVIAFSPASGKPFTHGDPSFDDIIRRYFLSREGNQSESLRTWSDGVLVEGVDDVEELTSVRAWLDGLRVEGMEDGEELITVRDRLEEIKWKIKDHIDDQFVSSLLA